MQRALKCKTWSGKKVSSKFKGVSFHKKKNKYIAYIQKDGKRYSLGNFKNEKDAAKAYNEKAIKLYGKYAYQNKL
jgi:hypothetical protein